MAEGRRSLKKLTNRDELCIWKSSTRFVEVDFNPNNVLLMIGKSEMIRLIITTDNISNPNQRTINGALQQQEEFVTKWHMDKNFFLKF